jgi:hypothetical protein
MHHAPAIYRERRRKLTPEELAPLPGLYRDGLSIRAIAKVQLRPQFGAQMASRP